ncbi:MAG: Na/Pi cotransporter family protein [Hyphomicrobiales bacterium]|nr:Na/Pi cotransporter family protein [Hyphomicrobiales bacterium]
MGSLVLLDLLGGVALLLWGLHMVLTGVLRAFGPDLRRFLNKALRNRFSAFVSGLGLTALLQSSTATGLMTTSLAADGLVGLVPALAIMLGANVGTTLIVQVLSFNISAVAPIFFVVGVATFRVGGASLTRALGRIAIGLGLILLALHILIDTLAPAEQAPLARALLASITGDPILCIALAAVLTWAAHSSVAVVLLVMSLAYSHFVSPEAALAMVLGANLGSAINPLIEGGIGGNPASRRLPLGNLINRLVGVIVVLPFLPVLARELPAWQPDASKMTAEFHMLFNVALALIFIGPLDAMAWLLVRILPDRPAPADPATPRYLDESILETPPVALANAARETLRMGDTTETMLRDVMTALLNNDRKLVGEVSKLDNVVDRLNEAIKLYITKLTRGSLDEREGRRAMEIVSFTINLEHIGDIIDKNLCELATKKIKGRYQFSAEGAAELSAFHKRVCDSLQQAFGVFMTGDVEAARRLLREKAELRTAELAAADRHFERLREGRPESLETTSLHLDVLSDLKRIHSHICSVAYPVLEAAGDLPAREVPAAEASAGGLTYQPRLP